jgi:hypothetical protein
MKVLARATQLTINLETVSLSPALMERLSQRPEGSSLRPPYQPAARAASRLSAGSGRRPSAPTFCVKFRLPGEKEEASFCSRKVTASQVEFSQRKTSPVIFNSKVRTFLVSIKYLNLICYEYRYRYRYSCFTTVLFGRYR